MTEGSGFGKLLKHITAPPAGEGPPWVYTHTHPEEPDEMTITEFLLARIARDEGLAQAIVDHFGGEVEWESGGWEHNQLSDVASMMQRAYSPDRVLAECESKRQIVESATAHLQYAEQFPRDEEAGHQTPIWETVLSYLAAVYADHPDYRDEWRP